MFTSTGISPSSLPAACRIVKNIRKIDRTCHYSLLRRLDSKTRCRRTIFLIPILRGQCFLSFSLTKYSQKYSYHPAAAAILRTGSLTTRSSQRWLQRRKSRANFNLVFSSGSPGWKRTRNRNWPAAEYFSRKIRVKLGCAVWKRERPVVLKLINIILPSFAVTFIRSEQCERRVT